MRKKKDWKKKKNNIWKEKRVKSAPKKKKKKEKKKKNEKNRTIEKKESGKKKKKLDKVRVDVCCTGQFGISKWDFFSSPFTLQIGEIAIWWVRGENLWTPIFLPIFFSYQIHQNIIFFLLFFSIILKIHPTKQTSLEKSSISLY